MHKPEPQPLIELIDGLIVIASGSVRHTAQERDRRLPGRSSRKTQAKLSSLLALNCQALEA